VAQGVVDFLEVVEVDQQQRQRLRGLHGAGHRAVQAFAQQGAVGQAGERVEMRLLPDQRLRGLALGDVDHDAAVQHAGLVMRHRGGVGMDPFLLAVGQHHAELHREAPLLGAGQGHLALQPGAVVGVDQRQDAGVAIDQGLGLHAEQRLGSRAAVQVARPALPVGAQPVHHAWYLSGHLAEVLLAGAQRFRHRPLLVDRLLQPPQQERAGHDQDRPEEQEVAAVVQPLQAGIVLEAAHRQRQVQRPAHADQGRAAQRQQAQRGAQRQQQHREQRAGQQVELGGGAHLQQQPQAQHVDRAEHRPGTHPVAEVGAPGDQADAGERAQPDQRAPPLAVLQCAGHRQGHRQRAGHQGDPQQPVEQAVPPALQVLGG